MTPSVIDLILVIVFILAVGIFLIVVYNYFKNRKIKNRPKKRLKAEKPYFDKRRV